jgi:homotetrameric cytidine deaminase
MREGAAVSDLETQAATARGRAYAPYSKFAVGAAIRMTDGRVFTGANVENASYGLAICAERTAIFAAIHAGATALAEVVVYTEASPPASPCGACRQVLAEFARDPASVAVTALNGKGERKTWTLGQLLPDNFSGSQLP